MYKEAKRIEEYSDCWVESTVARIHFILGMGFKRSQKWKDMKDVILKEKCSGDLYDILDGYNELVGINMDINKCKVCNRCSKLLVRRRPYGWYKRLTDKQLDQVKAFVSNVHSQPIDRRQKFRILRALKCALLICGKFVVYKKCDQYDSVLSFAEIVLDRIVIANNGKS